MKVAIFGGTGFIGRNLAGELSAKGHQVYVVTRSNPKVTENTAAKTAKTRLIQWGPPESLSSVRELRDTDVIINLAGESIGNRRWTDAVKEEILTSRIKTTRAIVSAINDGFIQPEVFISASAVGYYGPCGDGEITETACAGQDFLAGVCREWEGEAQRVENSATRVAIIRMGVVLGTGGALDRMLLPFKYFIGGPLGSGKQWLSWIHIADLTGLISFIMEHQELQGAVNATAPEPVPMKTFCAVLGHVLKRPSWLPVPEFLLRIALGQMAEMLLHGQRAMPQKALGAGFQFRYPNLKSALGDIL